MIKYSQTEYKSISQLIECFGLKRDAYYKYQRRANHVNTTKETVLVMAKERRRDLPREGGKKMYQALKKDFLKRDFFNSLLTPKCHSLA